MSNLSILTFDGNSISSLNVIVSKIMSVGIHTLNKNVN